MLTADNMSRDKTQVGFAKIQEDQERIQKIKFGTIYSAVLNPQCRNGNSIETGSATLTKVTSKKRAATIQFSHLASISFYRACLPLGFRLGNFGPFDVIFNTVPVRHLLVKLEISLLF
jgi:hypothetical protein